jgi:hypothetical protein
MKLLTEITNDFKQRLEVTLEDNNTFILQLEFIQSQNNWFYSITYGDNFRIVNHRLVTSFNILRQYRRLIPFGIGCTTSDGTDPYYVDDFVTGRVEITILTQDEVNTIEQGVYNSI